MSNLGFSVKGIRKVFIHLTEKLFVLINMMLPLAKLLVFQSIYVTVQLIISAYCWLTVSRNNRISSVMSCNTFDMSVTCSFIGIKVQRESGIRKKIEHLYSLYTKILEEKYKQVNTAEWLPNTVKISRKHKF